MELNIKKAQPKDITEKVIIYADIHEKSAIVTQILQKKCDLRFQKLVSADYRLSTRLGVERKTTSDFLQSIIDGRLFSQLRELKRNFSKPILLIEGNGSDIFTLREINENAIRGALASVVIDYSIPVIWTQNPNESAMMMLSMARREQFRKKKSTEIREKPRLRSSNEEILFLVTGLPGISTEKARTLLKKFSTPQAVFAATEKELMETDGIGKILAKRIHRIMKRGYEKSILED